jgi:hypothetical protein
VSQGDSETPANQPHHHHVEKRRMKEVDAVSQGDSETLSNLHPAAMQYLMIISSTIERQPPNYAFTASRADCLTGSPVEVFLPFHSLLDDLQSDDESSSSVLGCSTKSSTSAGAVQYGGESGGVVNRLARIASTDSQGRASSTGSQRRASLLILVGIIRSGFRGRYLSIDSII